MLFNHSEFSGNKSDIVPPEYFHKGPKIVDDSKHLNILFIMISLFYFIKLIFVKILCKFSVR